MANPDGGHILQSRGFGEVKAHWGWRPRYVISEAGDQQLAVLFLSRSVPALGELWYAPKGPGVITPEQAVEALGGIEQLAPRSFVVKVEPEIAVPTDLESWTEVGWVKSPRDVQITRATIFVDLRGDEESILASFKSKTRYNIRLAARKGVRAHRAAVTDRTVEVMYRLMAATQSRAGFTLRPRRYFEDYWRLQNASGQGEFFFASKDNQVLAGIFVTFLGRHAWYKDGGSTKQHHELMAPHLLQWEVMRWLRQRGVERYDLVAVPRPSELSEDHPLYGLQRFKSGFCEEVTEFVGTWDIPLRGRRYRAWESVGERLAAQWTYRVHQDLFY